MKIKNVLYDLLRLEYETGRHSGLWEEEYSRLETTQEWNKFVEQLAMSYGIGFDSSKINHEDEYELDEFTFALKENIQSKLLDILNIKNSNELYG